MWMYVLNEVKVEDNFVLIVMIKELKLWMELIIIMKDMKNNLLIKKKGLILLK